MNLDNGKYMGIQLIKRKPKTETYNIYELKYPSTSLGVIEWYPPWRQYCFFPSENIVFNAGCLDQIIEWIKAINEDYKTRRDEV